MTSKKICCLSFIFVSFQFVFMASLISGIFDNVNTECGVKFYAENSKLWPRFLSLWFEMPANSFVNIGYVVVGTLWLVRVAKNIRVYGKCSKPSLELFTENNAYYFIVFCFMAIFYGPIQFVRILTQAHRVAVLDQWMTLPFFSWVISWSFHLLLNTTKSFSVLLCCLSVTSYSITLISRIGFECVLAFHVFCAIVAGVTIQRKFGNPASQRELSKAVLFCCGFIWLKILDMKLSYWTIFQLLSGHFWSKLCDILQIHFACNFFTIVTLLKNYKDAKTK